MRLKHGNCLFHLTNKVKQAKFHFENIWKQAKFYSWGSKKSERHEFQKRM